MKTKNDNDRKRVKTNELAEQRNAEGESGKRMGHALGNGGKPLLSGKKAAGTGQPAHAKKPVRSRISPCAEASAYTGKPTCAKKSVHTGKSTPAKQSARAEKPVRSGNLACKAKRVSRRNERVERKVCRCCGKNLPLEDFYVRGASLRPDSYCKACRRAAALRQREQRYMLRLEQTIRHTTPLITEEADATLRMGMILHARGVVFASKQRKRAKEAEAEDLRVNHEIDKEEEQSSRSEALRTETSRTGTLPSETSCFKTPGSEALPSETSCFKTPDSEALHAETSCFKTSCSEALHAETSCFDTPDSEALHAETSCFETPGSEALHAETSCPEASSSGALCSKNRNPEASCKLPSETKTSTSNPLTEKNHGTNK